ncbi:hypothetical protein M8818_000347 [Zalaria obscura]|uniref:Uncharacterized protein n=1 Tax=Zalaria obscura TaxID=2024903 RepID=A0ACC3SPL2_9PEZI
MSGDSDFEPKRAGNNYIEDVGSSMSPKDPANAHGYLPKHGDRALALVGDQHIELTEEDILDKSVLGYGAVFGLQTDTHLKGSQYSFVGSIAPIAQLAVQPFTSILIVKVPHRILMPALCLGWGIAQAAMAACNSYSGLIAARFFLGLFEGGCLPLFSVITSHWYRRAEQPIRVAACRACPVADHLPVRRPRNHHLRAPRLLASRQRHRLRALPNRARTRPSRRAPPREPDRHRIAPVRLAARARSLPGAQNLALRRHVAAQQSRGPGHQHLRPLDPARPGLRQVHDESAQHALRGVAVHRDPIRILLRAKGALQIPHPGRADAAGDRGDSDAVPDPADLERGGAPARRLLSTRVPVRWEPAHCVLDRGEYGRQHEEERAHVAVQCGIERGEYCWPVAVHGTGCAGVSSGVEGVFGRFCGAGGRYWGPGGWSGCFESYAGEEEGGEWQAEGFEGSYYIRHICNPQFSASGRKRSYTHRVSLGPGPELAIPLQLPTVRIDTLYAIVTPCNSKRMHLARHLCRSGLEKFTNLLKGVYHKPKDLACALYETPIADLECKRDYWKRSSPLISYKAWDSLSDALKLDKWESRGYRTALSLPPRGLASAVRSYSRILRTGSA